MHCMYEWSKVIYQIKTLDSADVPFEVVIHRKRCVLQGGETRSQHVSQNNGKALC